MRWAALIGISILYAQSSFANYCSDILEGKGSPAKQTTQESEKLTIAEFENFLGYSRWDRVSRAPTITLKRTYMSRRDGGAPELEIQGVGKYFDLNGLGFNVEASWGNSLLLAPYRLSSLIENPFLDAAEIRLRQGAVKEILNAEQNGVFFNRLTQTLMSDKSREWRAQLWDRESDIPEWFRREMFFDNDLT